jgi:hypothetical protein
MKVKQRGWKKFIVAGAAVALVAGLSSTPPNAYAGGTIKADDDKWISVGMGIRTSFNAQENGATNGTSYNNDFAINNARIYINGQIHKYVKFTFNTECFNCGTGNGSAGHFGDKSNIGLLDAIGKFEINEKVNLWVGRTLVPSERGELNGPFYHATFDGFRTPFYPGDQSANIGQNSTGGAGLYGRDNGAVFFGKLHPFGTHLLYVASVFQGLRGAGNPGSSLMYAGRLQWNLLNDEDNPGYYTSGTYYGTAGDILAIAMNYQHQKDGGSNSAGVIQDFNGISVDLLAEKLMPNNMGVLTINGEFKRFWAANAANVGTALDGFSGTSWTGYALYLIPTQVGIGRFQPYGRFTQRDPRGTNMRTEWEAGVNYIIAGHNARVSAYWRYGDIATNYLNHSAGATGQRVDSFHVALQLQY